MLRLFPGGFGCGIATLLVGVTGCANGGSSGYVGSGSEDAGTDATTGVVITNDGSTTPVVLDSATTPDVVVPTQTCVHDGDCTAGVPNLCLGTNGVAFHGGFCVPTGKPMNCDDGISCTSDSCDATSSQCVHTPNDAACPAGAYCDPKANCVASLPCTPGDSVCDRLDTSSCAGLWSCDATKLVCVQANAPCPNVPNAQTLCDGSADAVAAPIVDGGSVSCSWQCNPGYAHLVWNGSAWAQQATITPPPDTGGCDCMITETSDGGAAYDPPELSFTDSNCDGIDGTVASAIFVDTIGGTSGGAGPMASPHSRRSGRHQRGPSVGRLEDHEVYVSKGTYAETVNLVDGVSIYGGYDASNKWARSSAQGNASTISSQSNVGIDAHNLATPFTLQLLTITTQAATGTAPNGGGQSAYGVRVVNCGGATVQSCTINVGAGAAAPSTPPNGPAGASGSVGGNGAGTTSGSGGPSACGATGGAGAAGVGNISNGSQGSQGTTVSGGGAGGPGGTGGNAGTCSLLSAGGGDDAPSFTPGGGNGNAGSNAPTGSALGSFDSLGNYLPATGIAGGTGTPGGGGGGGGSGGGTQHGCGFLNTSCCESDSGAGGGGGGGGCGGNGGGGGLGGGGSFAFAIVGSSLTTSLNKLTTGLGGNGGPGGNGGSGGSGGGGGSGGTNTNAGDHAAGNGANGQSGGSGGEGGGGSGGAGGGSFCFGYAGTSPSQSGDVCSNAGVGVGGLGGSNGISNAASGPNGPTGTVNIP